jgi:uncharacterized protein YceK
MMSRQIAIVLAIATASGCGTICNLISEEPKMPLGGVQADLQFAMSPNKGLQASSGGTGATVFVALVCADMTLSAVGDILTFPLALYLIKRTGYQNPDPEEAANSSPSSDRVFSSAIVDE